MRACIFLELLLEVNDKEHAELNRLHKEANQLLSIVVATIKTMRSKNK